MLDAITETVEKWLEDSKNPLPAERLRTVAISHYLQRPIMATHIDTTQVLKYAHISDTVINRFLDHMSSGGATENKKQLGNQLLLVKSQIEILGNGLEVAIDTILGSLGPLASI